MAAFLHKLVTLIMTSIWIGIDYMHKETASPVPLAQPPTKDGKLVSVKLAVGFMLGWVGTLVSVHHYFHFAPKCSSFPTNRCTTLPDGTNFTGVSKLARRKASSRSFSLRFSFKTSHCWL